MQIEYVGEHLWAGWLGNAFVVTSFICAFVGVIGYFNGSKENDQAPSWKLIGRGAFYLHSISVIGMIALLLFMLAGNYFEYHYVWQHSNSEMPMRYLLSSFWEGQEGSFMLWTFWHVIIGLVIIRTNKEWEAPVMAVFCLVQLFLASMTLGVYVLDYKIGSNPFALLLREHPDFMNLPLFRNTEYLNSLDGRGLNPLLQNYWMTIHPPTLFLGFASTMVPFAYAIAGLWKHKYSEWTRPALPWAFFGVMVLGTGILMGGAWAYEALSFGGFWAWDPVENASLVPWITFVGAAHLMVIHKNKGTALMALFFLTIITFILILYSTFLTRSGILGDASVHAFTDLGMSGQLLLYLLFFLGLGIVLFVMRYRDIPKAGKEEALWSREFWMFVGGLVLFCSAVQISFTTSLPVINKVFGTKMAQPEDPFEHYHKFQILFAVIVLLLMSFGQFLKYKKTDFKKFIKQLMLSLIISICVATGLCYAFGINELTVTYILFGSEMTTIHPGYLIMLFACTFAIIANLDYFIRMVKGKVKNAGASIAHIGFGLLLLGALVSTSTQHEISVNTSGFDISPIGENFSNNDNILLYQNDTLPMGEYYVSYRSRRREGVNIFYEVEYMQRDKQGKYSTAFTLQPRVQTNERMGNVAEPDTRHFWDKDIYTHVTFAELEEKPKDEEFQQTATDTIGYGDTLFATSAFVIYDTIVTVTKGQGFDLGERDTILGIRFICIDVQGDTTVASPLWIKKYGTMPAGIPYTVPELNLKLEVTGFASDGSQVAVNLLEKSNEREFIIMQAIVFPWINILWSGCVLLIIGTIIALLNRIRQLRATA